MEEEWKEERRIEEGEEEDRGSWKNRGERRWEEKGRKKGG